MCDWEHEFHISDINIQIELPNNLYIIFKKVKFLSIINSLKNTYRSTMNSHSSRFSISTFPYLKFRSFSNCLTYFPKPSLLSNSTFSGKPWHKCKTVAELALSCRQLLLYEIFCHLLSINTQNLSGFYVNFSNKHQNIKLLKQCLTFFLSQHIKPGIASYLLLQIPFHLKNVEYFLPISSIEKIQPLTSKFLSHCLPRHEHSSSQVEFWGTEAFRTSPWQTDRAPQHASKADLGFSPNILCSDISAVRLQCECHKSRQKLEGQKGAPRAPPCVVWDFFATIW